jgi:hypothetical protein
MINELPPEIQALADAHAAALLRCCALRDELKAAEEACSAARGAYWGALDAHEEALGVTGDDFTIYASK